MPHTVITDNGRQFIDKELAKFYIGLGIKHITSSIDDRRHTASVVGMGDVVDRLDMAEVSFSGRRSGSSASKATRDGVNGAT